jgi:hypothetical protein
MEDFFMSERLRRIVESAGQGETVEMAGLKWFSRYSNYRAKVAWVELSVNYNNGEYIVSVAGKVLKARAKDVEEGAVLAIKALKQWTSQLMLELDKL